MGSVGSLGSDEMARPSVANGKAPSPHAQGLWCGHRTGKHELAWRLYRSRNSILCGCSWWVHLSVLRSAGRASRGLWSKVLQQHRRNAQRLQQQSQVFLLPPASDGTCRLRQAQRPGQTPPAPQLLQPGLRRTSNQDSIWRFLESGKALGLTPPFGAGAKLRGGKSPKQPLGKAERALGSLILSQGPHHVLGRRRRCFKSAISLRSRPCSFHGFGAPAPLAETLQPAYQTCPHRPESSAQGRW
ncbi:uncharacterized protein LOC120246493 [Hyaena hyaena]|uniref:uncharacterized protein LOC120246493 n=1 Tax=Hyaena hyaena TaxID=95912 RepID=UPI001922626E|nr:uncharacterized protein LOC120246493 [Hyaena hyaena]